MAERVFRVIIRETVERECEVAARSAKEARQILGQAHGLDGRVSDVGDAEFVSRTIRFSPALKD